MLKWHIEKVYEESDAWVDLGNLGLPFLRTGSREICNPAPMDTDADFVILDLKDDANFEENGFKMMSSESYEYGDGDFETYRRGEVNLIVVHSWDDFKKWKAATAAAKNMNLTKKHERIELFQGILYGNW
jgi:hypothetical protein